MSLSASITLAHALLPEGHVRPHSEDVLELAPEALDPRQLLVRLGHLGGRQLRRRGQHVLAIEALLVAHALVVERRAAAHDLQVALVPAVVDEALHPARRELLADRLERRLPVL